MNPRDATLQALREVSAPVIGIALVLSAVFLPTAFLPGITGRLYQQFALTIAISVILSAFNALSLSPALSAMLLRPRKKTRGPLGWFYDRFNRVFGAATHGYVNWSRIAIRKSLLSFGLLGILAVGAGLFGSKLPSGFLPEDRAGKDVGFLSQNLKTFLDAARKRPEFTGLITTFLPNVPQIFVNVDRDKVLKQGIDLTQVYQTLQTFMGGFFVNYFNRFGRTWQVYIEAEGDCRTDVKNVGQFFVRNANGDPVPLDAISTIEQISGPEFTLRYN